MTVEIKPPVVLIASIVLVFSAVIALMLWAIPGDRRPFEYMVAGTFATALTLLVVFLFAIRRRW